MSQPVTHDWFTIIYVSVLTIINGILWGRSAFYYRQLKLHTAEIIKLLDRTQRNSNSC